MKPAPADMKTPRPVAPDPLLTLGGAELALAYVRHSFGESLEQKQAE